MLNNDFKLRNCLVIFEIYLYNFNFARQNFLNSSVKSGQLGYTIWIQHAYNLLSESSIKKALQWKPMITLWEYSIGISERKLKKTGFYFAVVTAVFEAFKGVSLFVKSQLLLP